jgi:hypothetical protein
LQKSQYPDACAKRPRAAMIQNMCPAKTDWNGILRDLEIALREAYETLQTT